MSGNHGQSATGGSSRRGRLSDHVAEMIRNELIERRMKPGDQLPTEPELAARFDVSRGVVREAGRILDQMGLVDIRPGRGMVVKAFDASGIAEQYSLLLKINDAAFEQLMQLRVVLEVGMSRAAAESRTDADLAAIETALETAATNVNDYDAALDVDLRFHLAVARASGNPFFESIMNPVNECLRTSYRNPISYLASQPSTLAEHREIFEAIRRGDGDAAEHAARRHLERVVADAFTLLGKRPVEGT